MEDQSNRPHRPAKEKKAHTGDKNPKAFAFNAPGKLQKQARRSHDVWLLRALRNINPNSYRSKKSASTSPSSTASPKKRPQSSSASSALPA
jgi:hypothetical protein